MRSDDRKDAHTVLLSMRGNAPEIDRLKRVLPVIAQRDNPVIIQGHAEAVKELFARTVHLSSHRSSRMFLVVESMANLNMLGRDLESFFSTWLRGGTLFLKRFCRLSGCRRKMVFDLAAKLDVRLLLSTWSVFEEMKKQRITPDEILRLNPFLVSLNTEETKRRLPSI